MDTHTPEEPVWTYRGYQLDPANFTNAMVHFFRAQVMRADVWRQRLDNTTNWAVITTGAAISISFGEPGHHPAIILCTLLVTLFLVIEARRCRYYELWSSRVRLMETDFFAAMLVPPFRPSDDWADSLARTLLRPEFPISSWEAFGRRFRFNYAWIYLILALSWFVQVALYPEVVTGWSELFARASLGAIPGEAVLAVGLAFNGALVGVGLATRRLHQATGEVFAVQHDPATQQSSFVRALFRRSAVRPRQMCLIVTADGQAMGTRILEEMNRGVTRLPGTGMYTGGDKDVLLCALTDTEVAGLKNLAASADPHALVIVVPAGEIFGAGFADLERPE